jgi:dephospho-CoA kinase
MPRTVGLTGGIGAGKSTVAALFKDFGAEIIVGDDLGRRAVDESPQLQQQIRERFGAEMFAGGNLDRRKLANAVFKSGEHVRWLTEATFPFIYEKWCRAVEATSSEVIVFDAALIFEWQIAHRFDTIIAVTAADEAILERAPAGRFSPEELVVRRDMQLPIADKIAGADIVIENNGSLRELEAKVRRIWKSFKQTS